MVRNIPMSSHRKCVGTLKNAMIFMRMVCGRDKTVWH